MEIFHTLLWVLLYTVSGIGVLIVLVGVVEAAWRFLRLRFDGQGGHAHLLLQTDFIRERLGAHLLLGLDFFVAADIIKSTLAPSWENVGILAAIVAIRIALSYFLSKEMEQTRRERSELQNESER
ncbi:DUF1622 domain-containing protein [Thioalkalivibrio sulfidiphilus]|uniref:DUF1622 domain-containing protein n=1 Tax=Thioalkalivibrio sulfidiphilus (strain HL-EbGR7) TaxID=396588 RepID=B8GPA6_THISH|nr:DUF1622 domain-containing protein [Thioalkalivibrio sulfidiphilus]ACL74026.1 conserved hypothetical protein [Thioalkalivibrio sulfidiphilus HL-EbGr7]